MSKPSTLKSSELIEFIAEKISQLPDWKDGFSNLLHYINSRLSAGGAFIRIYHQLAHRYLDLISTAGSFHNPIVEAVFDQLAEERMPIALPSEFSHYLRGEIQYSVIGIPILKKDEYLGALVLAGSESAGITETEYHCLLNFAPYLIPLFESAVLQEMLLSNYLDAIETLAVALEAKDPFTRGHSNMVCAYALAIARKMGFSEDRLKHIEIGSMMHDIGKIGVPDYILLKPSALTREEFDLVKRHPVIGEEILRPMQHPIFEVPRKIVRWHHERIDGKGYPDGLKGDQIPIEARITFVADAFEAMTSDRPFRRAFSIEEAFDELACNAGSQFDPDVVDVLCSILSPPSLSDLLHRNNPLLPPDYTNHENDLWDSDFDLPEEDSEEFNPN